jgi:hypothetical protein
VAVALRVGDVKVTCAIGESPLGWKRRHAILCCHINS